MNLGLKGKVALVTGASKGMGKAIAMALAREGARVALVARTKGVLTSAAEEIRRETGADIMDIVGDVADPKTAGDAVRQLSRKWKGVDILVTNAGGPPPGSFLTLDEKAWSAALQQNFLSAVRLSHAAVPYMKEKKWGRIVHLTSTIAKEPSPNMVLSASARAALLAFSKATAIELAPFNITVNAICPGSVQTDRAVSLIEQAAKKENKTYEEVLRRSQAVIPAGRFGSPEEIAAVVVFLVSEPGSYLTGVSLPIDGGLTKGV